MKKIRIGIAGASGYSGGEILRLLLQHPQAEVVWLTAGRQAGLPIEEIHPNLRGLTSLVCQDHAITDAWRNVDLIFLALPHGESPRLLPAIPQGPKVIDLGGDFRLRDLEDFRSFYKTEHPCFSLQPSFVYGLPEIHREAIAKAERIASPGCFATATILGLAPLIAGGWTEGKVIVDAKTGSSGSGAQPSAGTHHPFRETSFLAYKTFAHQHRPEILQALRDLDPSWDAPFLFQTHSAPMVRGIFATIYATLRNPLSTAAIRDLFADFYRKSPFIRLVKDSPNVHWVRMTNFADIGFATEGREIILFVAIDNLVKGAAGQAIQTMNLLFGLPEITGLWNPGCNP